MRVRALLALTAMSAALAATAAPASAQSYNGAQNGVHPDAYCAQVRQNRMMIGGPIKFNAKGQVEGIGSAAIQNLNQRPTVVLPVAAAEAKPVFPVPGYVKKS